MFREMRRFKQQTREETVKEILRTEKRCVLSVNGDDGYPYGVPMNFIYDEEDNTIYFHCAKEGHKIDAIKANPKSSVTVYNQGFQEEGDWVYNVTSVIAFGKSEFIEDEDIKKEKALNLAYKYYPTKESAEAELKHLPKMNLIAFRIEHVTGKLVNES